MQININVLLINVRIFLVRIVIKFKGLNKNYYLCSTTSYEYY